MSGQEKLIKIARGLEKADLVIKNANIINVLSEETKVILQFLTE